MVRMDDMSTYTERQRRINQIQTEEARLRLANPVYRALQSKVISVLRMSNDHKITVTPRHHEIHISPQLYEMAGKPRQVCFFDLVVGQGVKAADILFVAKDWKARIDA